MRRIAMDRYIPVMLLILILTIFLSACASNKIYRSNYETCVYKTAGDCAKHALQIYSEEDNGSYQLGFVEYDDQGQLRDPDQMRTILDEYRRIAGLNDVLLITFVHGWHHNAKPLDSNIASFRNLLVEISKMEVLGSRQQKREERKVLGLYIGWRGESLEVPFLNNITFWDRKNAAHNVGQQGVTEVLLKLEEIVNVRAGFEEEIPPPVNSRFVVMSHSFGGAVVYTSLQNILADRFIDSRRNKTFRGDANGFGDLVVLLNPAFEAIRYASLYDLSQQDCRRYFPTQLPKLAILTSEADYATKYAFPVGRLFSTLFESHLTLDRHYCIEPGEAGKRPMKLYEGKADRTTVGHFTPYLTHRLNPVSDQATRSSDFQVQQIQKSWSNQSHGEVLSFEGSHLIPLGRTTALNPYLNIQVDRHLMNGHNDIWRPQIINFLRDLIFISTTPFSKE